MFAKTHRLVRGDDVYPELGKREALYLGRLAQILRQDELATLQGRTNYSLKFYMQQVPICYGVALPALPVRMREGHLENVPCNPCQGMIYSPAPLDTVALVCPTKRWHYLLSYAF